MTKKVRTVTLDALVLLKILQHCRESSALGRLVGVDEGDTLTLTNALRDNPENSLSPEQMESFLRHLRENGFDTQTCGWYQNAALGTRYLHPNLIDGQFKYQQAFSQAVVIICNPMAVDSAPLQAYQLTDAFMESYKAKKFTAADTYGMDVLRRVDIKVANSSMLEAVMHQLNAESIKQQQSRDLTKLANPALHAFQKAGNPLLEKLLETMSESLEDYGQESWKWTQWNRSLQKERNSVQASRKRGAKQTESIDEAPTVQKILASEPDRYQALLCLEQIRAATERMQRYAGAELSQSFLASDAEYAD